MQQFQVPQFIDVEDKLFGPLTIKQFVYLAGGGGLIYLYIQLTPQVIAFILALPTAALTLALAFHKINGQSFIKIVQAYVQHLFSAKMFLWQKDYNNKNIKKEVLAPSIELAPKHKQQPQSNLRELSWSLDVLDDSKK